MEHSLSQVKGKHLKMFSLLLCIGLFLGPSCKKDVKNPILPPEENLKVIWQYNFTSGDNGLSVAPFIYENTVLTSFRSSSSSGHEILYALDKEDGSLLWEWQEYVRTAPQKFRGKHRNFVHDGSIFLGSSQDVYEVNIQDGSTLWYSNQEDANPRISQGSEHMYSSLTYGTAPTGDSSSVIMRSYDQADWTKVFTIVKTDAWETNLETASEYYSPEGDRFLIFQNRTLRFNPFDEKVDLYCYNQSADSLVWIKEYFTPSGSSNVQPPIVENDRLYFGGKWDVVCMDLPSGDEVWRENLYWDFQGSNILIWQDLIITNLDNGDLIALNKNSGNIEWVNEGLGYCCTEIREFDGRIYIGNKYLFIVDAASGELLHKYSSPNPQGEFYNAVGVDLENERMYCSDGFALLCMELPE